MSPALADVWPAVVPRLYASLRARSVRPATCEEAIQEVGVRALASGVEFTSAQDFYRWARAVAHNYVTDLRRRGELVSFVELAHASDQGGELDVAVQVETRLRLEEVWQAIASMSPLDQRALVLSLSDYVPSSKKECNYWATRRRRARDRLTDLFDGALVGMGLVGWRWRSRLAQLAVPVGAVAVAVVLPVVTEAAGPTTTAPRTAVSASATPPASEVAVPVSESTTPGPIGSGRSVPAPHTRPDPVDPSRAPTVGSAPAPLVEVTAPGGPKLADVYAEEPGPEEHLVCVGNLRLVGRVCVGEPLR